MNKRCPKCGFNLIECYKNICNCKHCGKFVTKDGDFVETDLRRFEVRFSLGWQEVYKKVYQIDILKIIKLLKVNNNISLSDDLIKFINGCEKVDELKTDFERKLPKGHLSVILED